MMQASQFSKETSRALWKSTISTEKLPGVLKTETIIKVHQSSDDESNEEDDNLYSIEESETEVNFSLRASSIKDQPTTSDSEEEDAFPGLSVSGCDKTKVKVEQCDELGSALHEEIDIKSDTRTLPVETERKHHQRNGQIVKIDEYIPQLDSDGSQLKTHALSHGETTFQCTKYPTNFATRSMLSNHQLIHRPKDQAKWYKCSQCSFRTISKDKIRSHYVKHKVPLFYECQKCSFKTKSKKSLKYHVYAHLNPSSPLKSADPHKHAVEAHLKTHQPLDQGKQWKCSVCAYTTVYEYELKLHQNMKHENANETLVGHLITHDSSNATVWYMCAHCPYKTVRKYNLPRHLKVHKPDDGCKKWRCSKCTFATSRRTELTLHQNVKHGNADEFKIFQCRQCPYKCYRRNTLKSHLLTHVPSHQREWYSCVHCPHKTSLKSSLSTHLKVHQPYDKRKKWKCLKCSYETLAKNCLKKHELSKHGSPVVASDLV